VWKRRKRSTETVSKDETMRSTVSVLLDTGTLPANFDPIPLGIGFSSHDPGAALQTFGISWHVNDVKSLNIVSSDLMRFN